MRSRLAAAGVFGHYAIGGWPAKQTKQTHQAVLNTYHLTDKAYGLNQLRYDLRKPKGHGLLERDGRRYTYRLNSKGIEVALLFLFFHKRLCGPSPTAAFIIVPTLNTAPTATSKRLITRPAALSKKS